jgi:hypothetical protein
MCSFATASKPGRGASRGFDPVSKCHGGGVAQQAPRRFDREALAVPYTAAAAAMS